MAEPDFRCGTIAVVGRPNVGKSTLINCLIGQKISITSRKPQTTRYCILGVTTRDDAQFVFIDTPGFQHRHGGRLNRIMNRNVLAALGDTDVVIWVVEGLKFDSRDQAVAEHLCTGAAVVLALSKIDLIRDKGELLPHIARLARLREFAAIVPVSVKDPKMLRDLLDAVRKHLPAQAALYDEDDVTDRSERFLAAEFIREKLFRLLGAEIPYSTHVTIEKFELLGGIRRVAAEIVVSKASHKAIVLGRKGERLKAIATAARIEMEKCFGGKVFLEVWVKHSNDWENDDEALRVFGYR